MKTFCICFEGVDNMLSLNRIKIDGFRNISNVEVEMKDIVSLLSINSYGKSNYLNGIIFGIDFIHAPLEIKSRMMNYEPYKPFNKKNLYKNFSFEMELSYNDNKKTSQVIYGYSFEWENEKNLKPRIVSEYLKIKEDGSQKFTSYINRENNTALYKSSLTGSCTKKINIEKNELVLNKIIAYDELYYLKLIKMINTVSVYVDKHFNTNSAYNVKTRVRKDFSEYNLSNDTNVPRILSNIKRDFPNKFDLIVNTLRDIFPFIENIEVVEYNINSEAINKNTKESNYVIANNVYFLIAFDKNLVKTIDFSSMSDGVRRVLLIFTTLVLADINNYSLVGIEEPENSLSPKVLQRYLIALKGFAEKTKIIITSHSPYLINYMNPSNIYLGLPNNDGLAMFSKIKEKSVSKLLNDAEEMDMLVGDYLFDLMSGSAEDLEKMIKYVE